MSKVNLKRMIFGHFITILFLISFSCTSNKGGVAKTKLDVLQNKYGRNLVNKDANKTIQTLEVGDTFEILDSKRESATDFYLYYKVRTKNGKTGYLFEGDSFIVIEP